MDKIPLTPSLDRLLKDMSIEIVESRYHPFFYQRYEKAVVDLDIKGYDMSKHLIELRNHRILYKRLVR